MAEPSYTFTRDGAARIARAVKQIERGYRNSPPERSKYPILGASGSALKLANLPAIGPGSLSSPAHANGTIYDFNGTTTTNARTVTIYNICGAVSSGPGIVAYVDGYPFVVVECCASAVTMTGTGGTGTGTD